MTLFYIALREGLEFSAILLLLIGVYPRQKNVLICLTLCLIISGALITWVNYPLSGFYKKAYTGFMPYSFIMLLLLSFISGRNAAYPVIGLVLALFVPSGQLASVILEEISLKGAFIIVYALGGMITSGFFFSVCLRFLSGFDLRRFFGTDGVMVFLASFCFVSGGMYEFDSTSVITALQQGFHTFFSYFIPFMSELLLIPNGGTMTTSFDVLFGYLLSQRVATAVAACILLLPPIYVFIKLLSTPGPVTDKVEKKADRRKLISGYINELLKKGTPLLAALFINIVLLHSDNLAIMPVYEPEPIPVVTDGDAIAIPLTDRSGDVSDGKIRKYSFLYQGETYRFIVVMRPDGEVVAVLDACEICPPRGYVQRAGNAICKYCNTPVPLQSFGQPGGCNPIPIKYKVEGDTITVDKREIRDAYEKEAGKEGGGVMR